MMVALPLATAVTIPLASTVATASFEDVQVTVLSSASSGRTVTLSARVTSLAVRVASDLSRVTSVTAMATVTSQVAEKSPALAVMVALPLATAVTTPFTSTVATVSSEEVQVTVLSNASSGRTFTLSSRVASLAVRVASDLSSLTSVTATATVTLQVAVLPPAVAVMVAVPLATAVTTPFSFTVATLSSEVLHVTALSVA